MKIVKHIPNTITLMNLLSGACSIIFAFQEEFTRAFVLMLVASLFDFLDGFAARGLKAYSEIGKELDSLCDTVSFGLAPSLILYNYMRSISVSPIWVAYIPLLIALFSALRLAKFNLDTRQSHSFIGLPTPACALFLGAIISYSCENPSFGIYIDNCYTIPAISIILSYLLISEHPFLSLKLQNFLWRENKKVFLFFIIAVPTTIAGVIYHIRWSGIFMLIMTLYLIWNLLWELCSTFFIKK